MYNNIFALIVQRQITVDDIEEAYELTGSDFKALYEDNFETCGSVVISENGVGDADVGLFTRNNPPTIEDIKTYGCETINGLQDDILANTTPPQDFISTTSNVDAGVLKTTSGWGGLNQATYVSFGGMQNASFVDSFSGNTTLYFYDIWLTPYKVYTIAINKYYNGYLVRTFGGSTYKFVNNVQQHYNLVLSNTYEYDLTNTPNANKKTMTVDGTNNLIPTEATVHYNPSLKLFPIVVDECIGFAISVNYDSNDVPNWLTPSDLIPNLRNIKVTNSYKDNTYLEGGSEENDVKVDGFFKTYYGIDNEQADEEDEITTYNCMVSYVELDWNYTPDNISNNIPNNFSNIESLFNSSDVKTIDIEGNVIKTGALEVTDENIEKYTCTLPYFKSDLWNGYARTWIGTTYNNCDYTDSYNPILSLRSNDDDSQASVFAFGGKNGRERYENSDNQSFKNLIAYIDGFEEDVDEITETTKENSIPIIFKNQTWIMYRVALTKDYVCYFLSYYDNEYGTDYDTFKVMKPYFLYGVNTERSGNTSTKICTILHPFNNPYSITSTDLSRFCSRNDGCFYYNGNTIPKVSGEYDYNSFYVGKNVDDVKIYLSITQDVYLRNWTQTLSDASTMGESYGYNSSMVNNSYRFYYNKSSEDAETYYDALTFCVPVTRYNNSNTSANAGQVIKHQMDVYLPPLDRNKQQSDKILDENGNKVNIPVSDNDNGDSSLGTHKSKEDRGTHKNTVTPVTEIKMPDITLNVARTGLISLWKMDENQLNSLATELFDTNIFNQIKNGIQYPKDAVLKLSMSRINPKHEGNTKPLKLGIAELTTTGQLITNHLRKFDLNYVDIPRKHGNKLDYEAKISLHLPFIKDVELDSSVCMGRRIFVEYECDFLTGNCVAQVFSDDKVNGKNDFIGKKTHLLGQYCGNFFTELPLGQLSNDRILTSLSTIGVSLGMGRIIGRLASVGEGLKPSITHASELGSNNAMYEYTNAPMITIEYTEHIGQNKIDAYTSNTSYVYGKLGRLSFTPLVNNSPVSVSKNYIKCDNPTYHNNDLHDEENIEINELLSNGVAYYR